MVREAHRWLQVSSQVRQKYGTIGRRGERGRPVERELPCPAVTEGEESLHITGPSLWGLSFWHTCFQRRADAKERTVLPEKVVFGRLLKNEKTCRAG